MRKHLFPRSLLLAFALMAAFSAPVFAQKGLEAGIRVVPQTVWLFNDDDFAEGDNLNFATKFTVGYGASIGYNFSDALGIQTGILISEQGQKYTHEGLDYATSEASLKYTKIPVMLKFNSSPYKPIMFVTTIGAHIGLLNSVKYEIDGVDISAFLEEDAHNKMDISAALTMGLRARIIDHLHVGFSLAVNGSIPDIENKDYTVAGIPYWATGRAATRNVSAGFMFEAVYTLGSSEDE